MMGFMKKQRGDKDKRPVRPSRRPLRRERLAFIGDSRFARSPRPCDRWLDRRDVAALEKAYPRARSDRREAAEDHTDFLSRGGGFTNRRRHHRGARRSIKRRGRARGLFF